MITVIDYGAGNIGSISNALRRVGAEIRVSHRISPDADAIVLPGVGNFGDAMGRISQIRQELLESIKQGTPFLGLCLGLQVLFEGSEEAPGTPGLGLVPGKCRKFTSGKVPHMGWNQITHPRGELFDGISDGQNFYFVHSFYAPPGDYSSALCNYGADFSAAVQSGNVYACQFHPERSGKAGLRVLENFVELARR